jgi:myo-inositol 2-dehydrogenase / D-chiro-inositol 1-dehydrogenase
LNIGLIGTGRIGRIHAENLALHLDGARLAAVTDAMPASAREVAARYNVTAVHDSAQALLADANIHAVAICSSTDTHAGLIIDAARAGKHVFCEKPIALDLATIDAALAAVDAAGVKLVVGFNRRYHPNFRRIRDLVHDGAVGKPHLFRITSRDSAPPPISYVKVSGGIFLDMTIHDFDMARYVIGSEVVEVFATGRALIDPAFADAGDVDTAVVVMHHENGTMTVIDNSREAVYGYDQRLEVFGALGMARCDNSFPDSVVTSTAQASTSAKPHFAFLDIYRSTYRDEMNAFVECIRKDLPSPVSGRDGRIPLVMGIAATRSLREGRPVKLSEIDPA